MTRATGRLVAFLDSPMVTRIVTAMVLVLTLSAIWLRAEQLDLTQCVAAYNDAANANSRARTAAAEYDRLALDEMIKGIAAARHNKDQTAIDEALSQYLQKRAFANGQRESSPMPAPPSETCG